MSHHHLFAELPQHLEKIALFAINTGCRESEICHLPWDWEIRIPEMPYLAVFIIPPELVKNGKERLVVCNQTAKSIVDSQRGKHKQFVFSFKGKPLTISRFKSSRERNTKRFGGALLICGQITYSLNTYRMKDFV